MNEGVERLELCIDYWTDFVGTFDPWKVLWHVKKAFPQTILDDRDHQDIKLQAELSGWREMDIPEDRKNELIRSSIRNCRDNGPTYRFQIPFEGGCIVAGCSRRYRVWFELPQNTPASIRESLQCLLRSLNLGTLQMSNDDDE